jgi:hypothetical protein
LSRITPRRLPVPVGHFDQDAATALSGFGVDAGAVHGREELFSIRLAGWAGARADVAHETLRHGSRNGA